MESIDYDTEHSLANANLAKAVNPDDSLLNVETSLASQRRLIRKQLPEIPVDFEDDGIGGQSYILGRSSSPKRSKVTFQESCQRAKQLSLEEQRKLDWWPDVTAQSLQDDLKDKSVDQNAFRLNSFYRNHLLRIIECSLKKSSNGIATSILEALEQCLESLGQPDSMQSLQRSFSLLWRIEALIRSNEQLEESNTSKESKRWPRLVAWRGTSSSNTTTLASPIIPDETNFASSEARRRKRDIALQLLSNTFWIAGASNVTEPLSKDHVKDVEDAETMASKSKTFPRKSAPQLLVRNGTPTVALQTADMTTDIKESVRETSNKEITSERSSVLTNRLAMQLKNSEGSVKSTIGRRQRLARPEEENRMTICKVCCDFVDEVSDEETDMNSQDYSRSRSGTMTLAMHRRQMNNSQASTRSDRTLKGGDKGRSKKEIRIEWKVKRFQGDQLSLNPLCSANQQQVQMEESTDDSRVQFVGGSFFVQAQDLSIQEQESIRESLDLGLYVACAMMFEIATLRNLGVVEANDDVNEKNELEITALPQSPALNQSSPSSIDVSIKRSDSLLEGSLQKSAPSRWPKSVWGIIHYSNGYVPAPLKRLNSNSNKDGQAVTVSSRGHAGKALAGYSGRLGKVIDSITGVSHRQSASDEEMIKIKSEEGKESLAEIESENGRNGPVEMESKDTTICPLHISPYYSQQSQAGQKKDGTFLDTILADQSLTLNVVEGSDITLSLLKTTEPALAPRASLQSRNSYNDTEYSIGGQSTDTSIKGTVSSISSLGEKTNSSTSNTLSATPRPSIQRGATRLNVADVTSDQSKQNFQFHQRSGSAKDICLGQALEEMAAKAKMLHQKASVSTKKSEDGGEKESETRMTTSKTYRIAQYLNSYDRILISATVFPTEQGASDDANTAATEKSDIAAVVKASRLNQDLVRSAIFLSEHFSEYSDTHSSNSDTSAILLWNAEISSKKMSPIAHLSNASYLQSYGSFIKDLLSHPNLIASKYESMRMFKIGNVMLKFLIQPIIIFDLLVEGPVVVTKSMAGNNEQVGFELSAQDKKILERTRSEIRDFYASIKRHISALEHVLVARDLDEKGQTIKSSLRNKKTIVDVNLQDEDSFDEALLESIGVTISSAEPLSLLSRLKKVFRTAEFELYDALKGTQASCINDIRIKFHHCAKSARKRLQLWEEKHLTKSEVKDVDSLDYLEPEYFSIGKHPFPGSLYLVRQDEPLSLIAYCLSSRDYDEEVRGNRESVIGLQHGVDASISSGRRNLSATSSITTSRASILNSGTSQDPDDEDDYINSKDAPMIHMKRKKRIKDASILSLSLKRVSSNISFSSASDGDEEEIGVEKSSDDTEGLKTPTASKITPLRFNTISSASTGNETFVAQIVPMTPGVSLGSMFEVQSTASSTPAIEQEESFFPDVLSSIENTVKNPITPRSSLKNNGKRDTSTTRSSPPSPHIKHSITSGNIKFSCVSWFAEDFATLRDKWNINFEFIQSMSRCKNWNVGGGKSKSGFYLSLDEKWIAKQLLNIWSVDEKEAFLEFAPAYLRYMMNSVTNNCPTLLVKIAGVYTLKIKDIKTGEVKLKMSIQVLENVFSGDDGSGIRFDIKGMKDRKISINKKEVESTEEEKGKLTTAAPVWWDAEFLECFSNRAFVPEAQKDLFTRALHNDLAFLTASNIIDYSLLIGAYEGQSKELKKKKKRMGGGKEIEEGEGDGDKTNNSGPTFCVRIVDFLGAFTLVKYIESSSKKAIRSQAPTVIPPRDYASRFAKSVETYFISCPDL